MLQSYEDHRFLSSQNEAIFYGWLTQFNSPLRIVIGYEGFKNESSFLEKSYAYLLTKVKVDSFGPFSVPDLIIRGESCIVKLNRSYIHPFFNNGKMVFFGTNTGHTIEILCETIVMNHKDYSN